jgi:hypothetical protein
VLLFRNNNFWTYAFGNTARYDIILGAYSSTSTHRANRFYHPPEPLQIDREHSGRSPVVPSLNNANLRRRNGFDNFTDWNLVNRMITLVHADEVIVKDIFLSHGSGYANKKPCCARAFLPLS